MAETAYLIDSSIWIQALAPRAPGAMTVLLRALLEANTAVVTDMVRLEVLAGAKSSKEFDQFRQDFDALRCLSTTTQAWRQAEDLGCALGRRGLPVPSPDLLIAAVAVSYDVPLWHADKDFERIKQVTSELRTLWYPHHSPVIQ